MDIDVREIEEVMIKRLEEGTPILFSANEMGLPEIQEVKNAEHKGYGHFEKKVGDGVIYFNAGGSMYTLSVDGRYLISWTMVRGNVDEWIEDFGYNFNEVIERLERINEG